MLDLLITLIMFAWPLGQLLLLPSFGSNVHWTLLDLLNLLLFCFVVLKDHKKIRIDPLSKYMLLFIFIALISLILNFQLGIYTLLLSSLYLFRFITSFGIYFALKFHFKEKYLNLIGFSLILFLALGLLQYIFLPDLRFLKNIGFDDHLYRLTSTFLDP